MTTRDEYLSTQQRYDIYVDNRPATVGEIARSTACEPFKVEVRYLRGARYFDVEFVVSFNIDVRLPQHQSYIIDELSDSGLDTLGEIKRVKVSYLD